MGWRPDWREAAKRGVEGIEAMLYDKIKQERKRKEEDDKFKTEIEKLDYQFQLGIREGQQETYRDIFGDEKYPIKTRVMAGQQLGIVPEQVLAGEWGTPEYWQGMRPLRPEEIEGVGREMFGEPAVAEEEKTYKEKVTEWIERNPDTPYPGLSMEQTHKVVGAYVAPEKGPTVAERKLGMDAVSVAALIRQGLRTERTALGEQRFNLTSKQRAIDFAGEMGWTEKDPEYQQQIAPAIEEWWTRYQPQKTAELKRNSAVRKAVKRHLKKEPRLKGVKIDNEAIDIYIEAELEKVTNEWKKW